MVPFSRKLRVFQLTAGHARLPDLQAFTAIPAGRAASTPTPLRTALRGQLSA